MPSGKEVLIDYVNHRGEWGKRLIVPARLYFGEVEWHPGGQWLLEAWDVGKNALRTFAMKDIQSWLAPSPEAATR